MQIKMAGSGLLLAGIMVSGVAQATLVDRGGGLLYDDVLNITWLQDANYAKTSGYDASGRMASADAKTWAANLMFHDAVRGVDYSDWRLPFVRPVNGSSFDYSYSTNGTTDVAYNITGTASELSYMYYVNLGLRGYYSLSGDYQSDYGPFRNASGAGEQTDVGMVKNLQANLYWFGTPYEADPDSGGWGFYAGSGYQDGGGRGDSKFYTWAVRDGDVAAAIPEPNSLALLGLSMVGLAVFRRKRIACNSTDGQGKTGFSTWGCSSGYTSV